MGSKCIKHYTSIPPTGEFETTSGEDALGRAASRAHLGISRCSRSTLINIHFSLRSFLFQNLTYQILVLNTPLLYYSHKSALI